MFAGFDREPYEPNLLSASFRRAAKRAERPGVHFHVVRHTHASLLLSAGVHPKVVFVRLGHTFVAFTIIIYSHIMPGLLKAVAEALDQIPSPRGDLHARDIRPVSSLSGHS